MPRKIPGAHFCWKATRSKSQNVARRIRLVENSSDLIENRTRYFPACSIVPQPTMLPTAMNMVMARNLFILSVTELVDGLILSVVSQPKELDV
jgi:hypothetical protein